MLHEYFFRYTAVVCGLDNVCYQCCIFIIFNVSLTLYVHT